MPQSANRSFKILQLDRRTGQLFCLAFRQYDCDLAPVVFGFFRCTATHAHQRSHQRSEPGPEWDDGCPRREEVRPENQAPRGCLFERIEARPERAELAFIELEYCKQHFDIKAQFRQQRKWLGSQGPWSSKWIKGAPNSAKISIASGKSTGRPDWRIQLSIKRYRIGGQANWQCEEEIRPVCVREAKDCQFATKAPGVKLEALSGPQLKLCAERY